MPAPANPLKAALKAGTPQLGCWLGLGIPAAAEIAAEAGFDWCLIDAEHSPNTLTTIADQLRAMHGRPAAPVVRVPVNEDWVIKQVLDLGAQSVLVPMVDDAESAARAVSAMRYPPGGTRGVGATIARASEFSRFEDYLVTADAEICVMVQAESRSALDNIDAIAGTEGVDCVFIGPADLAADLGYLGQSDAPEVVEAIDHMFARITAAGKAVGFLDFNPAHVAKNLERGVSFLAVGSDITGLSGSLQRLAREIRT